MDTRELEIQISTTNNGDNELTASRLTIDYTSGSNWGDLKTALEASAITDFDLNYEVILEGNMASTSVTAISSNFPLFSGGLAVGDRRVDILKAGYYHVTAYIEVAGTLIQSGQGSRNKFYLEVVDTSGSAEVILARGQSEYIRFGEPSELRMDTHIPLLATDMLKFKVVDAYLPYRRNASFLSHSNKPYSIEGGFVGFSRVDTAAFTPANRAIPAI